MDNTAELDTQKLDFCFVHWDDIGQTVMVYYTFTDSDSKFHHGYLRYDCGTGDVYVSRLYAW